MLNSAYTYRGSTFKADLSAEVDVNLTTRVAQGKLPGRTWRGVQRVGRIFTTAPHIGRLPQYEHGKPNKMEKRAGRLRCWANDKRMMIQSQVR